VAIVQPVSQSLPSGPPGHGLEDWPRALFDGIDDALFIHDLRGRILEANHAACQRLGYTREEMLCLTTRDIDDPTFAAGFEDRLAQQMNRGQFRCEGRHRAKDGRLIAVDINTSMIQFDGQPAVLALMRDMTERARQATQYAVTRALEECADLERAGPVILRYICEGLGGDVGSLWLVDPTDNLLHCQSLWLHPDLAAQQFDEWRQQTFAPGQGLPGRVWSTRDPAFVGDVVLDKNFPRAAIAQRAGLKSGFAFPIRSGGETIGVIEALQRRVEQPDAELLAMLAALGSQIGQVLEHQRVEKALRDSEAFYHALVESLPQNIFRKDLDGRVTFGNQRYCNTLGKTLAELLGKTDFDLFPARLARKYVHDDRQVMATGKVFEAVEEHHLPDGSDLYVQVIKSPVWDRQGQLIGTQGVFWDVTARKRAELAVAESEHRYRQLTEATQDGIVVADQQGRITLFNPAAERLFGYRSAEVVGQQLGVLMPDEYRNLHEAGFQHFLQTRQAKIIGRPVELHGRRQDGTIFPLELALSVIDVGGNMQFLGAIRDLTERNRIRAVLVQNEKLASIGLLSAGVAHEINNPLAFVANNLVVLERDFQGLMEILNAYESLLPRLAQVAPEDVAKVGELAETFDLTYVRNNLGRLLARTRDGVDRVTRIVQSLRGLARTETPKRQEANVAELVENNLEILRGRLKRNNVEVRTAYDVPNTVPCVQTQISQVLLNLLVNALQAIEAAARPECGTITVATKRLDGEMLIEVSDNGIGIDPPDLPKVFDPFFTTKGVGEGTGLGLSIAHNIIRAHGGRIEVESSVNTGSRFRVFLPTLPSPLAAEELGVSGEVV
jgi:PAS domain S-box-containing protein